MKKILNRKILLFFIIFSAFLYLNNSSIFRKEQEGVPFLLAHRGMSQTFPMEEITAQTNTAAIIFEPDHPYLENTIPSIKEAFRLGADMVEFDIQLTKDGIFAVFHDAVLEYRTNGTGHVSEYEMDDLKKLDIGYGYTADNGKSHPFRGKGIGLMPSLDEVFTEFQDNSFLIHIKRNDAREGEALARYLKNLPETRLDKLAVYGGDKPVAVLKQEIRGLRVMSRATLKKAVTDYMLLGWAGIMPESMKNTVIIIPLRYARFLWGWPHCFTRRIKNAGSLFILVSGKGKWSEGFDSEEDLTRLSSRYKGGIWTNRIDRIGPILKNNLQTERYSDET